VKGKILKRFELSGRKPEQVTPFYAKLCAFNIMLFSAVNNAAMWIKSI
jgi:hypothetical protein